MQGKYGHVVLGVARQPLFSEHTLRARYFKYGVTNGGPQGEGPAQGGGPVDTSPVDSTTNCPTAGLWESSDRLCLKLQPCIMTPQGVVTASTTPCARLAEVQPQPQPEEGV